MARLFVAVPLDDAARAALAPVLLGLRACVRGARCPDVRDLHVTLQFLGEVEASRVPAVCAALAPLSGVAGGAVALRGLGTFPEHGRARIVHARVSDADGLLAGLAARTAELLAPLGFAVDDVRAYTPHVTLARLDPPSAAELPAVGLDVPIPVRSVTVFESRSGAAPRHQSVHQVSLATSTSVRAGPGRQENHDHRPPA